MQAQGGRRTRDPSDVICRLAVLLLSGYTRCGAIWHLPTHARGDNAMTTITCATERTLLLASWLLDNTETKVRQNRQCHYSPVLFREGGRGG